MFIMFYQNEAKPTTIIRYTIRINCNGESKIAKIELIRSRKSKISIINMF